MTVILRPGQRILNIPGIGVTTSRRAVASAAAGNGLKNALIAYWKLDEASGDAIDAHTNGLTLTATATAPGADTGKVYGTARTTSWNGNTSFSRAYETLIQLSDVDFTFAAWVYQANKNNYNHIISKSGTTGAPYEEMILRYQSGNDRFNFEVAYSAGGYASVVANNLGSPSLNTWYLVICWHDSVNNQLCIQVNNGTVDTASHSGGVLNQSYPLYLARQHSGSLLQWDGRFGPVAFWKSAAGGGGVLTADQRTALFNAGAGLAYAAFTT